MHWFTQVFHIEDANAMNCSENIHTIIPNRIWLILNPTQHTNSYE